MLYIFLANRNGIWLEKVKTGKDFAIAITKFRSLLSGPEHNERSAEQFSDFQKYGYLLYSYLISPVSGRFVSDELVISPDYMLSFFPFETLVTDNEVHTDRLYSKLPYLMNDFEISYSYSATLLSESGKTRATLKNKLLAFAPSYDTIYIDSVSVWRQNIGETLTSLKYSGEEASFVSRITGGDAFIGKEATRLRFIAESGNFNILHLAMHTVLKSKDPVNSGLIFFKEGDSISNILTPYDIYSLPLNAKMVVLSSCYTGSGTLYSGEGVLSLARGFIFSGSRSVMMSLWEVDDRSGMEIIKSYYRKLKKGIGKSRALKEARMEYLNNADMAAAHPYYWSTLVIYGDDSPLYISRITRILLILIPLLLAFNVWSYLRKR
jgi:CHAT domain-containing protein